MRLGANGTAMATLDAVNQRLTDSSLQSSPSLEQNLSKSHHRSSLFDPPRTSLDMLPPSPPLTRVSSNGSIRDSPRELEHHSVDPLSGAYLKGEDRVVDVVLDAPQQDPPASVSSELDGAGVQSVEAEELSKIADADMAPEHAAPNSPRAVTKGLVPVFVDPLTADSGFTAVEDSEEGHGSAITHPKPASERRLGPNLTIQVPRDYGSPEPDDNDIFEPKSSGFPFDSHKPSIPHSSYYNGPPALGSAFGTDPVGQIGIHYPREIVRIERDYSGGELPQFHPTYPLELEGRITPTQFQETINDINEILISAYSIRASFFENIIAACTFYLSTLFADTHYNREMRRLKDLIDQRNVDLYHPAGLAILWPRSHAFMYLEIEYY